MSLAYFSGFDWAFLLSTRSRESVAALHACRRIPVISYPVRYSTPPSRSLGPTLTQRAGGVAFVEPRYLEDKRPDIHVFFPDDRILIDVWEDNAGAQRLYSRFGFGIVDRRPFQVASGAVTGYDLIMELRPSGK